MEYFQLFDLEFRFGHETGKVQRTKFENVREILFFNIKRKILILIKSKLLD